MSNKNVTLSQLQKSVGNFKNYIQSNINIPYNDIDCYTLTPTIINNQFTNSDYIIFNSDTVSKAIINLDEPLNELLRDQKNILFTVIEDLDSTDTVNSDMLYVPSSDAVMNYSVSYKSAELRIYMYNNVTISFDENGDFVKTESTGKSSICLKYTLKDSTVTNTLNLKYTIYCNCLNKNCFTQIDLVRGKSRNSIQSYNLQDGCNTGRSSINLTEDSSIGSYSYITGVSNTVGVYSESALIFGRYNDVGKHFVCSSINGSYNVIDSNTRGANNLYIDIHGNKNHIYNSPAGYTDNVFINGQYLNISNSYTMAFGKYGDVPTTLMFALCNGTSETDKKVIFGIDRTGLAITDAVPTEDSHLTNKKYVDDKVASLVDSAPETLDTLKELSTALGNDPNFATTMATTLGNKVDKVDGKTLSTNDLTNELKVNYDAAYTHSQSAHFDGDYNSLSNIPTDLVKTSDADSKYASIEYVDNKIGALPEKLYLMSDFLTAHSPYGFDFDVSKLDEDISYRLINDIYNKAYIGTFIYIYNGTEELITELLFESQCGFITIGKKSNKLYYNNGLRFTEIDLINKTQSESEIYSVTQKVSFSKVLTKDNTKVYTPTSDYHPSTKKYVDDSTIEATDDEVDAMLLEVLGGDYSAQS